AAAEIETARKAQQQKEAEMRSDRANLRKEIADLEQSPFMKTNYNPELLNLSDRNAAILQNSELSPVAWGQAQASIRNEIFTRERQIHFLNLKIQQNQAIQMYLANGLSNAAFARVINGPDGILKQVVIKGAEKIYAEVQTGKPDI